ncbi:Tubby- protein 3 [Lathyrus oleraceus]|uniref:Tubby- protein 3 n=1 Tax=Pisum sativum TaxID=3888 RepID=A0A9D5BL92_PEA|nr:Tubby- protein 3 [Pisum sativum]
MALQMTVLTRLKQTTTVQVFPNYNPSPINLHLLMTKLPRGVNQYLNNSSTDDGKFLLAARKCRRATHTDYIISLNLDDVSRGSSTYVGKLRSNFLGTKFTVYDAHPPFYGAKVAKSRSTKLVSLKQVSPRVPTDDYPIVHGSYDLNVLGSRGPKIMQCVMDAIPAAAVEPGGEAPTQTRFLHSRNDTSPSIPFFRSKSTRAENLQSVVPLTSQDKGMSQPELLRYILN